MTNGIFGQLNENAFLVFSRDNKRLYARAIVEIYREFYGTLHFRATPKRADLCDFIARLLQLNPELWTDEPEKYEGLPDTAARRGRQRRKKRINRDGADPIALKADHVYARLLDCGWIEEDRIGFQIVGEMPPASQALAERFHELELGLSQVLGGVVIGIRNALYSLKAKPKENALGLKSAVDQATNFIRRLRGIHASLRGIERELVGSPDLRNRLRTFFEDFLGKILIQDFKAILTTNHPYRFKNEIVRLADEILGDPVVIQGTAEGYVAALIAEDQREAETAVQSNLEQVIEAFEAIDEAFRRINDFRMRLESRLRNTIAYMDRANTDTTRRLMRAIQELAAAEDLRAKAGLAALEYPSLLMAPAARLHQGDAVTGRKGSLALPPPPRLAIDTDEIEAQVKDPVLAELRRLESIWYQISDPSTEQLLAFLDMKLRPGESLESKFIHLSEIGDFFAFLKSRNLLKERGEFMGYRFERLSDMRIDDWAEMPNFRITRGLNSQMGLKDGRALETLP